MRRRSRWMRRPLELWVCLHRVLGLLAYFSWRISVCFLFLLSVLVNASSSCLAARGILLYSQLSALQTTRWCQSVGARRTTMGIFVSRLPGFRVSGLGMYLDPAGQPTSCTSSSRILLISSETLRFSRLALARR